MDVLNVLRDVITSNMGGVAPSPSVVSSLWDGDANDLLPVTAASHVIVAIACAFAVVGGWRVVHTTLRSHDEHYAAELGARGLERYRAEARKRRTRRRRARREAAEAEAAKAAEEDAAAARLHAEAAELTKAAIDAAVAVAEREKAWEKTLLAARAAAHARSAKLAAGAAEFAAGEVLPAAGLAPHVGERRVTSNGGVSKGEGSWSKISIDSAVAHKIVGSQGPRDEGDEEKGTEEGGAATWREATQAQVEAARKAAERAEAEAEEARKAADHDRVLLDEANKAAAAAEEARREVIKRVRERQRQLSSSARNHAHEKRAKQRRDSIVGVVRLFASFCCVSFTAGLVLDGLGAGSTWFGAQGASLSVLSLRVDFRTVAEIGSIAALWYVAVTTFASIKRHRASLRATRRAAAHAMRTSLIVFALSAAVEAAALVGASFAVGCGVAVAWHRRVKKLEVLSLSKIIGVGLVLPLILELSGLNGQATSAFGALLPTLASACVRLSWLAFVAATAAVCNTWVLLDAGSVLRVGSGEDDDDDYSDNDADDTDDDDIGTEPAPRAPPSLRNTGGGGGGGTDRGEPSETPARS